jgi:hypothetical protein
LTPPTRAAYPDYVRREQCRSHNLFKTLHALGMSFQRDGVTLDVASGMAALEQALGGDQEYFVD